jgi:hypothetical protein
MPVFNPATEASVEPEVNVVDLVVSDEVFSFVELDVPNPTEQGKSAIA